MKKAVILIAGIAMVGIISLPLFAFGPGWGGNSRGSGYGDCPYYDDKGSDLTQDQVSKLDALRDEYRANTKKIREQLRDTNQDMRSELDKSDLNETRVRELQTEISKLRAELDSARIDYTLKVKKIAPDAHLGYSSRGGRHMGVGYSGCYGGSRDTGSNETF